MNYTSSACTKNDDLLYKNCCYKSWGSCSAAAIPIELKLKESDIATIISSLTYYSLLPRTSYLSSRLKHVREILEEDSIEYLNTNVWYKLNGCSIKRCIFIFAIQNYSLTLL